MLDAYKGASAATSAAEHPQTERSKSSLTLTRNRKELGGLESHFLAAYLKEEENVMVLKERLETLELLLYFQKRKKRITYLKNSFDVLIKIGKKSKPDYISNFALLLLLIY